MNLEKYVVVAGMPGVHKFVASRKDGLFIDDLRENRRRFVPVRNSQITPLDTIGIYVQSEQETIPLGDVFQKMLDALDDNPPVSLEAKSPEIREYFASVLPDHDPDRVHINDIKKCIKWFNFMRENGIFDAIKAEEAPATPTETTHEAEAKPDTPTAPASEPNAESAE